MAETKTLYTRLLEAQKEIGAIKKDSDNPYFKSKYVDINGILAVVKPVFNEQGLVLTQALHTIEGRVGLLTAIVDAVSGEKLESFCYLPEMSKPQETGSAITYYRRYALQSLLALEAEDDDGNTANGNDKKQTSYTKPPANPHVKKFEEDMQVIPEDLIAYTESLESAKTLTELKKVWETFPPMVKTALATKKEEQKFKLA